MTNKFPVRTVVASVLLLLMGIVTVSTGVVDLTVLENPWWVGGGYLVLGLFTILASVLYLVKRTPNYYDLVILGFWAPIVIQFAIIFFNKKEIRGELSADQDTAIFFFLTIACEIAAYAVIYFIGMNKKATTQLREWWFELHPELRPVAKPETSEEDEETSDS